MLQPNAISQQIEALASQSNLTPSQLLLWLGQKLNPDTPLYNMVFSFTIQGAIDPAHFQRAFQGLCDRCDIFHLTVTETDGVPRQQIQTTRSNASPLHTHLPRHPSPSLPFLDFAHGTHPAATARKWIAKRSQRSLDLETRLFDSALLKIAPDQFIWYINYHHLITDNWSVSLIYRHLQDFYGRSLQGTLAQAPAIPAYLHDAGQEGNQPSSSWQQKAIAHWQQKREILPPPVPLYGQSREAVSTHTERIYCELGPERSQALRDLAATPEARSLSIHQSQFNLFLTLLFAYLYRVSGSTELAIAAPAHNRPTPALKETPGVFMELFPLQVDIAADETFTSLLDKVARESMAFLRYAQPDISHHAIDRNVNVVLSYINVTFPDFQGIPTQTEWVHSGYGDAQHHLRLEVHDFDATGNFTLQFDFNRDLIPDQQRQWATEHFSQLLDAWLVDGQQPIATVDILAEAERSLLAAPNQLFRNEPIIETLVERFQQQAARKSEQAAVVWDNQTLTYAELDAQANQIAHHLIAQGIPLGATVGLFSERSIPMIAAILGILKAGAAYLPIDPDYPTERTTFMAEDGQIAALITQQSLTDRLPQTQAPVLVLERDMDAIAQQPTTSPEVAIAPDDLAYILFTSGSTGKPKGVMVEHRHVLAMLRGYEHSAPAGATLRGTALCSYSFDVAVWELFANLCYGGTVHLVPTDIVTSRDRFARYLIDHSITSAYIPPALLRPVIDELERWGQSNKPQNLKTIPLDRILVGVEPIQQGVLQRYRDRIPHLRIVNGYGPTETTICATFHSFQTITNPQANTPIGTAVPGYTVHLVNPQGQQVPIGVKGEIVIGGAGLSRGYLNRPELMGDQFVALPLLEGEIQNSKFKIQNSKSKNQEQITNNQQQIFYKTGDRARHLADGNLEFLGRIDCQVKIRGFRVELSEVEAALLLHSQVERAAVIAQPVEQGSHALAAYLVVKDRVPTSAELRDALQQTLPEYMVPGAFIVLNELPLTANGKVDRRRLASAEYTQRERLGAASRYVAPTGEWETYLADLWAQCLQVAMVGIHDSFFDLGGDSITAIQIAAQATEAGLVLSPQPILQHHTIARLLAEVNSGQAIAQATPATTGPIPLTPIQHAFFEQNTVDPHHWNQSLLLDVTDPFDPILLASAVQQLLEHHAVLRSQFTRDATGWRQQLSDAVSPAAFRQVDLSDESAAKQAEAIEADLQASLNLEAGDLVRIALFESGQNELGQPCSQKLLFIVHHLAIDGVSWRTLLGDLDTFYRQLQGETTARSLPTTPFPTWASGLVEAANSATSQAELTYWLQSVPANGQAPAKNLASRTTSANTVASTQTITTRLDAEATRSLLKDIPKLARAQVNEVLLTALTLAMTAQTDSNTVLVDLEGHGREEAIVPGVSLVRTVGWFTTVFPVLLTLTQADLGEQLQSVKEQFRRIPRNGIGYGLLRYLHDDDVKTQLQARPQANILFNYLGDQGGLLPAASRFHLARGLELSRSSRGQRHYQLEINVAIVEGQLQVDWSYSQAIHTPNTVQVWAEALLIAVRSLIDHYRSPTSKPPSTASPVDFPLANLNTQKLDKIAALLSRVDGGKGSG